MEISDNKILNINSIRSKKNIEIKADDEFFTAKFYTDNMYDGKEFNNLIKCIEKLIRQSDEYKNYIGYLKNEIGLNNCAVLGNIDDSKVSIEMHHYPFTLFDIVNIVTAYRILNGDLVTSFIIADEVLKLHYDNLIGLVPLCETIHDLVHAGKIFINLKQVFGDVNNFVEKYYGGLTDDYIVSFNKIVDMSNRNITYSDEDMLKKNILKNWNLQKNSKIEI